MKMETHYELKLKNMLSKVSQHNVLDLNQTKKQLTIHHNKQSFEIP